MLLVRTQVGQSAIHGTGLFAVELIPQGTLMWKFQPGPDIVVPFDVIETLPPLGRELINHYGYLNEFFPGGYVLDSDNARFINHSDEPNPDNSTEFAFAARDIHPGEEITCDYRD